MEDQDKTLTHECTFSDQHGETWHAKQWLGVGGGSGAEPVSFEIQFTKQGSGRRLFGRTTHSEPAPEEELRAALTEALRIEGSSAE